MVLACRVVDPGWDRSVFQSSCDALSYFYFGFFKWNGESAMSAKNVPGEPDFADVTKEQLITDFKTVVSDAEALIKATANQGGEALAAVRAKADASLARAKVQIMDAEAALMVRAKAAAKATDVYVHENPWKSIGISAGLALLVGFIMGRR